MQKIGPYCRLAPTRIDRMHNPPSRLITALGLLGFLILSFGASTPGILFGPGEWYDSLNRPFFTPPNWLFGPAWTVLYICMAVAATLVWRRVGLRSRAMAWWFIQLVLNTLWTLIFFGLQAPGLALIEITLMWGAILICMLHFRPVSPLAFWLMVPYLAWVTFAWALNAGFWWLNY